MNDPIALLHAQLQHQSQKSLATDIGCSPAYLNDVINRKRQPGPIILEFLGLTREIVYTNAKRRRKT